MSGIYYLSIMQSRNGVRSLPLSTTSDFLVVDNAVEDLSTSGTHRLRDVCPQNCPMKSGWVVLVNCRARTWQKFHVSRFLCFLQFNGIRVPEMYMCSTDGTEGLKDWRA
jgi:hypothetical protein